MSDKESCNASKRKGFGIAFQVICGVILVFLALYRVGEKAGIYFGDEFGYFSAAGFFAGYDWSEQISHLGYYGIGYGICLIPAFWFCRSVQQLMTYAVVLNCCFLLMAYVICLKVLKNLTISKSDEITAVMALFAISYVSNLCHLQMGWSETLNVLIYWSCLYVFYKMYSTEKNIYYILLVALLCFSVMVHMRNILMAIAGVLVIILVTLKEKKINKLRLISMLLVLIIGIIVFFCSKNYLKEYLYLNSSNSENNDIAAAVPGLAGIFFRPNFGREILNSFCAKGFYIISATSGIILFGLLHLIKKIKRSAPKEEMAVYLFALFSFGMLFILTIYNSTYVSRIDQAFYARYYEHTIGLLLALGLSYVMENGIKEIMILLEIFSVAYKLLTIISMRLFTNLINNPEVNGFVTLCASAVSKYWYKKDFLNTVINTFKDTYLILLGILVILFCYNLLKKKTKWRPELLLLIALAVLVGRNWYETSNLVNDSTIGDTVGRYGQVNPIVDALDIRWEKESSKRIYYYTTDYWNEYMLSLQAAVGKTKINNIDDLEEVLRNEETYIILDKNEAGVYEKKQQLEINGFGVIEETEQFILYESTRGVWRE